MSRLFTARRCRWRLSPARRKKFYGAKYILNLHDIFPQNAVDLGIIKNKLLIKFF